MITSRRIFRPVCFCRLCEAKQNMAMVRHTLHGTPPPVRSPADCATTLAFAMALSQAHESAVYVLCRNQPFARADVLRNVRLYGWSRPNYDLGSAYEFMDSADQRAEWAVVQDQILAELIPDWTVLVKGDSASVADALFGQFLRRGDA